MSEFLSNLPKIKTKSHKRLGRGYGSGKGGHTTGRGQKGQRSRGRVPLLFEGTKNKKSLVQRLPILRGKNKMKALKIKPLVVNLRDISTFPKGTDINLQSLIDLGLINAKEANKRGVKILSLGKLTHAVNVNLPVSKSVKEKIEALGGQVVN